MYFISIIPFLIVNGILTNGFRFIDAGPVVWYNDAENLSIRLLNIPLEEEGTKEMARRSRGTPRVANRLLRRVRDYAQIKGDGIITKDIAIKALKMLDVDFAGLDDMDKRLLRLLIENYNGGPVGLKTLAVALGEDSGTVEEIYEPYLIQQGFLDRTSQGRKATMKTYKHFKIKPTQEQMDFFE